MGSGIAEAGAAGLDVVVDEAAIAIWCSPWTVVRQPAFTIGLARRLGMHNVYGSHPDRYPAVALGELDGAGADLYCSLTSPGRLMTTRTTKTTSRDTTASWRS